MKKIMFNDKYGLTQAVLDGRKTMTRRLVPKKITDKVKAFQQEYYEGSLERISVQDAVLNMVTCEHIFNPPYKVGEVVAIAQSYKDVIEEWSKGYGRGFSFGLEDRAGMSNKMFVKPEYMPHHIRMTGLKVEYLQDISEEDCLREGIYEHNPIPANPKMKGYAYDSTLDTHKKRKWFDTPRKAFAALIDKVSGKGTWESNPLVYAYTFEYVNDFSKLNE